jgi:hypothetical protein
MKPDLSDCSLEWREICENKALETVLKHFDKEREQDLKSTKY